jgi:hypothetical protein
VRQFSFGVGPVDPNVECGQRPVLRAGLLERRAELDQGTAESVERI